MSPVAKLLSLGVIAVAFVASLLAVVSSASPLVLVALIVFWLLAIVAVALILFLDLLVEALRDFLRPAD
jgi:hypothetical protein